jgi:hypothetical protein
LLVLFHLYLFQLCFCIFGTLSHIYGHVRPPTSNIYRNRLDCGSTNAVMGTAVSAGNGSLQHCNASLFLINPPICATSAMMRWRTSFVNPCGRSGVKWASILLGNTAYLHLLQIITRNSGKWVKYSIWMVVSVLYNPSFSPNGLPWASIL